VREKRVEDEANAVYDLTYAWDAVGNRIAKTNGAMSVSYRYQTGNNRLVGWDATSTNDFIDVRRVDVHGTASEAIGTNDMFGYLYVSNAAAGWVKPNVSGSNFTAFGVALGTGTQSIVAGIRDAAANMG